MTAEQNPRQSSDEKHTYASQGTIGIDGESGDSSNSFWSKEEEAALLRKSVVLPAHHPWPSRFLLGHSADHDAELITGSTG